MNSPGAFAKDKLAENKLLKRKGSSYYLGDKKVIPEEDVQQFLIEYYDNPATGMRGRDALYNKISAEYVGISRRRVAEFLANQETAQVHKEVRIQPITRPAVLRKEGQWAVDLTWLKRSDPAENNDLKDSQILFTCVDQFSKYAWARILPNKQAATVAKAMQSILDEAKRLGTVLPRLVRSDNGSEFKAEAFAKTLAGVGARQRFSETYNPRQNAMIERFNKTIKMMIYKYMTQWNVSKLDESSLQKLVSNYNNTQHGTTQAVPNEIHEGNKPEMQAAQQNMRARAVKLVEKNKSAFPDLKMGDRVRVARRTEGSWRKTRQLKKYSYMKNFTYEIFTVIAVTLGSATKAKTYTLQDDDDNILMQNLDKDTEIPKQFIRQDLQKVDPGKIIHELARDEYVVDYVSDKKISKGKLKYLVHFVGYDDGEWLEPQESFKAAIEKYEKSARK